MPIIVTETRSRGRKGLDWFLAAAHVFGDNATIDEHVAILVGKFPWWKSVAKLEKADKLAARI
ncbi:MAG TPA: hypothetical protein VGG11_14415 [Xanthobacteraceae bacterium]